MTQPAGSTAPSTRAATRLAAAAAAVGEPAQPVAPTDAYAHLVIQPSGKRHVVPRPHVIKLRLELNGRGTQPRQCGDLDATARRALSELVPDALPGTTRIADVLEGRHGRPQILVALTGETTSATRPSEPTLDAMRHFFTGLGFRLSVREHRECASPGCSSEVLVSWNSPDVPTAWFRRDLCGRHNYRACHGCASIYVLTSSSTSGPAPSLLCETCGALLIAWGGSKRWEAERVVLD